jgi:C-terminal processing protease CtpA/Prc
LDLRSNAGGVFEDAIAMAALLLPPGAEVRKLEHKNL